MHNFKFNFENFPDLPSMDWRKQKTYIYNIVNIIPLLITNTVYFWSFNAENESVE